MTEENQAPPSNNMLYAVIGLLLIAGAIIFLLMRGCEEEKPPEPPRVEDTGPALPARTEIVEEIDIPDPDVGTGLEEPEPVMDTIRYVRRGGGGNWDCSGTVPAAKAARIFNRNKRQVRACYERALKTNNSLSGRLQVRAKIGASGSVTNVAVQGRALSSIHDCVRRKVRSWSFPAPTGGSCAVVAAPFNLTPSQ